MTSLIEKISSFPVSPGVYLMKGEKDKIIYVGKAKNLRARVKQYFNEHDTRAHVAFLVKKIKTIDFLQTSTEKEALLLENSLIKKHKPRYNIDLKDDKTYVSIKLSITHPYPALTVTRKIRKDGALYFGPFASAHSCRETVDFIYRHFRLRTCSDNEIKNRARPCLEYQIGRCTAPCVGKVSSEQYAEQIAQTRLFLEGKNKELTGDLKKRMQEMSATENFEEAKVVSDLLYAIQETLEKQKVVKHSGIHQDILFLYREGEDMIVALLSVRDGNLIDSRYYPLHSNQEDAEVLSAFISRFYLGEVFIPDEILVSAVLEDTEPLIEILSERKGKKIVLRQPLKGEKKDLLDMAQLNAKSQFSRLIQKQASITEILTSLMKKIKLEKFPHRIECYDISNISGTNATGSEVVFIDGEADKNEYRKYKIQSKNTPDDFGMMREVLGRRFRCNVGAGFPRQGTVSVPLPDLLIVDGGKGQLNVALSVLKECNLKIPVIGIAKGQGEGARAKGLWDGKKEEEIYLPHRKNPVILKRGSPELMLLQTIRDEAHRFAINYHRQLRDDL